MEVKVNSECFPHSATFKVSGDVGGNAQENTISFSGDQFDLYPKSAELKFYGAWELQSFFELVDLLKEKYYAKNEQ